MSEPIEYDKALFLRVTQVGLLPTPAESKKDGCMHLGLMVADDHEGGFEGEIAATLHIPFKQALIVCATIQTYMELLDAFGEYEEYLPKVRAQFSTVINDILMLKEIEEEEGL